MPMDLRCYPRNWRKISKTIRRIAHQRCEWCGVANGEMRQGSSGKMYRVALTVAHLGTPLADGQSNKHDKHDVRRENLAALCQRCHLGYDRIDHMLHRKENRVLRLRNAQREAGQMKLIQEEVTP